MREGAQSCPLDQKGEVSGIKDGAKARRSSWATKPVLAVTGTNSRNLN